MSARLIESLFASGWTRFLARLAGAAACRHSPPSRRAASRATLPLSRPYACAMVVTAHMSAHAKHLLYTKINRMATCVNLDPLRPSEDGGRFKSSRKPRRRKNGNEFPA